MGQTAEERHGKGQAMNLWAELQRRHVFRIAVAYAVTAWLLLQLAAILFPAFNAPHWALRALFGALVLGLLVVIAIAWAFEITPQGVRRTTERQTGREETIALRRRTGRLLNAAIVVILAAAVGVLAWRLYMRPHVSTGSAAPIPANSIAVLPFTDLSPQKGQAYLAQGIAEQLLDILAETTNLKVVARTSAFQFQGKQEDVRKIGRALDVRHILEGSVLRDKSKIRISVQLVNTRTGLRAQILPVLCSWHYPATGWRPLPATCKGIIKASGTATAE